MSQWEGFFPLMSSCTAGRSYFFKEFPFQSVTIKGTSRINDINASVSSALSFRFFLVELHENDPHVLPEKLGLKAKSLCGLNLQTFFSLMNMSPEC